MWGRPPSQRGGLKPEVRATQGRFPGSDQANAEPKRAGPHSHGVGGGTPQHLAPAGPWGPLSSLLPSSFRNWGGGEEGVMSAHISRTQGRAPPLSVRSPNWSGRKTHHQCPLLVAEAPAKTPLAAHLCHSTSPFPL